MAPAESVWRSEYLHALRAADDGQTESLYDLWSRRLAESDLNRAEYVGSQWRSLLFRFLSAFPQLTVRSQEALARRLPSEEKVTHRTPQLWPFRVRKVRLDFY